MLEAFDTSRIEAIYCEARDGNDRGLARDRADVIRVSRGEALFRPGETRACYRVETGALCHYIRWPDGRHEMIEFVFAGDLVGLGERASHISTAKATVDTILSRVAPAEVRRLLSADGRLQVRHAAAVDREFDYAKYSALREWTASERSGAMRLAAVLAALAHTKGGRAKLSGAVIVDDDLMSGPLGGRLGLTRDDLARAVEVLTRDGLVAGSPGSIQVLDLEGLDAFTGDR